MFCKQSSRKSMCNIFGMIIFAIPLFCYERGGGGDAAPLFLYYTIFYFVQRSTDVCTCGNNGNEKKNKHPAAKQVKMLKTYNSCSGSKYNCRKMYTHASILFTFFFCCCCCVQHNMRWVFVNTKCIIIINESEISARLSCRTVNLQHSQDLYVYRSNFHGFLF